MTASFYAGPDLGFLNITSWDDLVAAVQAGSLGETQWVECKEAIPAKSPGANTETARDLASLTVDGGVLAIGVRDKKPNQPLTADDIVGTADDIDALKMRLTHIASGTTIRPPMQIIFGDVLQHPDDPDRAVLLVAVPPSASAPHMVDGKYWGRDAQGKRALSDVEVDRLFHTRRMRQDDFAARLRRLAEDLDPYREDTQRLAHLYVLARPDLPPPVAFIRELEDSFKFNQEVHKAVGNLPISLGSPSFFDLSDVQPHAEGIARDNRLNPLVAQPTTYDRMGRELSHMRLFVGNDGSVAVASGRGSYPIGEGSLASAVDLDYAVEILHQVIMLARHLGSTSMQYGGTWTIGVHINNLAGKHGRPRGAFGGRIETGSLYATSEYTRIHSTSTAAMIDDPVTIVDELLHDHARGAGFVGDLRQRMGLER